MKKSAFPIAIIFILSLGILTAPASGFITVHEDINLVVCTPDDNNFHVDATDLEYISFGVDAVCDIDPHDWYRFQGTGYADWTGGLKIFTTEPGLRVNVYLDEGSGPQEVFDGSPEYNGTYAMYYLQLSINQACDDAGLSAPFQGNFYIRVSYFTAYPGNHPYMMQTTFLADYAKAEGANVRTEAEEVAVGEDRYGTLTQTDFWDWFYWDHPAGESISGVIELFTMRMEPDENAPDVSVKIYQGSTLLSPAAYLDSDRLYADLDLAPMGLTAGRYYICVALEESTNDPVVYRLRNRANMGYLSGCGADSNNDPSDAIGLANGYTFSDSLCHPRDSADYFTYTHDRFFIGDIVVSPIDGKKMIFPEITRGTNNKPVTGVSSLLGESYFRNPVYPGTLDIKVLDYFGATQAAPYEITVYPNGAGPYRAPGHGDWQSSDDMLQYDQAQNYMHSYWFELQPAQQDRYFFSSSTNPDEYLTGIVGIYGSQLDYEVRIGQLGLNGPAWGAPIYPDEKGKTTLDFGYGILSEPGDYVLRVMLNNNVTGRRRFYVTQELEIMQCLESPADSFINPGGVINYGTYSSTMNGALCPPDDDVDFGRFVISSSPGQPVGPGYFLTVKAGHPGMTFKLYDAFHTELWSETIMELGGTASVKLVDTTYFEGAEYWLEVSTYSTAEQLMLWRASFAVPIAPMYMEIAPWGGNDIVIDLTEILEQIRSL